jgi:serine/threonine protein kinase
MIGKTISHYRILEKLGEGGMGVVYKAEDTKLRRTVALKSLHPEFTSDEEAKTRFIHEARAAAALSHPHICTIYEIDEHGGRSFVAMEFIEGERLKDRIQKGLCPSKSFCPSRSRSERDSTRRTRRESSIGT